MSTATSQCIPSNSDISGIGVRTAVYAQNLITFIPALYTLADGKVTPTELESLETQSSSILIAAFALLISTIIEVRTEGLSNYHVTVILNLSWINNTNTFIYLLLYFYRRVNMPTVLEGEGSGVKISTWKLWKKEIHKVLRNPVLLIGSIHLSLMAAVGIWLWSNPLTFGAFHTCEHPPSVAVVGGIVPINSKGLQIWSLFIYSIVLVPGLNLVIPSSLLLGIFWLHHHFFTKSRGFGQSIFPVIVGLALLALTVILLLMDTERAITANKGLLLPGDSQWTFGQTLALVLLLLPLRDIAETVWERRPKELGRRLLEAAEKGHLDVVKYLVELGAPVDVLGKQVCFHLSCAVAEQANPYYYLWLRQERKHTIAAVRCPTHKCFKLPLGEGCTCKFPRSYN